MRYLESSDGEPFVGVRFLENEKQINGLTVSGKVDTFTFEEIAATSTAKKRKRYAQDNSRVPTYAIRLG
jgi:hypothetical protein